MEFQSLCGGLPAPQNNDNPFGYKFSWAPRGVFLASKNTAKQWIDNSIKDIGGKDLFSPENVFHEDLGGDIGKLEWYFNRDSLEYMEPYKLQGISTLVRVECL